MSALFQLIGEPPDDQITTEAQRRSSVMQCPPGTPQLLCRPIDQFGNLAIKPGRVSVSKSVLPAAFGPRPEDGSPECWRAEASWTGGFIGWPARECGTPGGLPLWPGEGGVRASS